MTTPEPERLRGRNFDDFAVGQSFESPRRTITEADIVAFAGLSGDFNPLHVDEEYARRTAFRGRIAHGLLVKSIASGLANQMGIFHGTISALAEMLISYRAPVRAGDTIRILMTVDEMDPEPARKRGWIRFAVAISNQADEVVIDGSWRTIILRKTER